ncbi:hypothetical protein [Promicromonospora iranensis]|uniref:Uncharacterized protein n=1 Tax=Promicromonospora iranensis TaxID=1105144 RepID=A0ABU2CK50_9MICO|nr:hypothetical protein [Promicromonospora iranensis]MDR7381572.1 hypothetical protein [Promicromonospora iranensis]
MTRNDRSTIEPVDEAWVAHVRELSSGIEPPTSANPHVMSRVAIRRTRTRRAVLATGGGVMTVAAVAGTAFALGVPATPGVLLPGGAPSATASASADVSASAEASAGPSGAAPEVPAGWHVHELEGLTYAFPPDITRNGERVEQEPGILADFWFNKGEDVPPYIRVAYLTPDYEFYDTKAGGLTSFPADGATSFELPGSSLASVEEGTPELREIAGAPAGSDVHGDFVRILVHRADGAGRYMITMTLPEKNSELVEDFLATLSLE